jgi:hypothetical protein
VASRSVEAPESALGLLTSRALSSAQFALIITAARRRMRPLWWELAQPRVWFRLFLLELCRKPDMQFLHDRTTVGLMESEPLLGCHALVPGELVVVINLSQGFQHELALLWKILRHLHEPASTMRQTGGGRTSVYPGQSASTVAPSKPARMAHS